MIEELVERLFATRNAAHIAHWREKSGYRHETLGAFYDALIERLDSIVEAHQGAFKLIEMDGLGKQPNMPEIESKLEDDLLWIGRNRQKLTAGLPALDNLFQDLEGLYLKTLYKLKNLR